MIIQHLTGKHHVKANSNDTTTNHSETDLHAGTGFDANRRLALKMIGGTAVLATGAAYTSAYALGTASTGVEETTPISAATPARTGAELSISLSVDPEPTIRITNHSNKLVIVRHVHPGIIHAGENAYDINSLFVGSAYAIGAGRSRTMAVKKTSAIQPERDFPRHLYANKPQRIVAVTGRNYAGILANSTRSFFA